MKTNTRLIQIKADASQWWSSLSKEEQEHYIEQHPKSKYAVDAKKEKEQLPVTDQKTDKPIPKHHIHKHAHRIVKKHLKEFHNDQKEFFGRKMDEAGSPERRSIGQSIKAKAKGILHAMKHEAKEYHLASGALVKLGKREKLDHHVFFMIRHHKFRDSFFIRNQGSAINLNHFPFCVPREGQGANGS